MYKLYAGTVFCYNIHLKKTDMTHSMYVMAFADPMELMDNKKRNMCLGIYKLPVYLIHGSINLVCCVMKYKVEPQPIHICPR